MWQEKFQYTEDVDTVCNHTISVGKNSANAGSEQPIVVGFLSMGVILT